jgi:RHS repeat-associated protein
MKRITSIILSVLLAALTACGGDGNPSTESTIAAPGVTLAPPQIASEISTPSGPPIGTVVRPKDIIVTVDQLVEDDVITANDADATMLGKAMGLAKLSDIIVDNQSSGFAKSGQSSCSGGVSCWGNAGGYNGNSFWTWNNAQASIGKWTPALQCTGNYSISAYIPSAVGSRTTKAPYSIQYSGGSTSQTVPQSSYSDNWASLGTYKFATSGGYVQLQNVTGETLYTKKVAFDAVKWVWDSPTSSLTITSPNGGETWTKGSSGCVNVTWNSSGLSDNVRIHLYRYGNMVKGLSNSVSNTGSYCVPKADFSNEQSGGGYTIGMSNVNSNCDGTVYDFSNSSFTIADPVITTPNLKPYTPSGWSGPLVVTSTNGGKTSGGTLSSCGTTYISWAVENNGSANIPGTFYSRLYLDGNPLSTWNTNGLNSGYYTSVDNWSTTIPAGTHSLQLVTDYTSVVSESNEGDNSTVQTFTWSGCAPPPATLSGNVTSSGSPVAGATVSALGPASMAVSTDSNGNYTMSGLPGGTYDVKASKSGYLDQVKTVSLSAGYTTVLPFSLTKIPAPVFYYSPNNIGVTMNSGGLNGSQTVVVKNNGDTQLDYTPLINVNWASLQKNGATITGKTLSLAPGAQDTLTVTFNSNGITSSQSGNITISHNDSSQGAQSVFLGLGINAPPPQPPPPAEQPAPSTPVFQPSLYGQCPAQNACYADPVNTAIGNYLYQHIDLAIASRGPDLSFTRHYNSLDRTAGPLGLGWTHTLNTQIIAAGNGDAYVRWGDGHVDKFTWDGSSYTPPAGVNAKLIKGNYYVLVDQDQTTWGFTGEGQLQTIADRLNNKLQLTYDSQRRLVTATNAVGESMSFAYVSSSDSKLASVSDFTGRKVQFSYSGNMLTQVTDVMGKTFGFAYDGGGYLSQITERDGKVLVTNGYDSSGRVIQQTDANGTLTTFAYNTPGAGQTTVTDPTGLKHIYAYDALYRLIAQTAPTGDKVTFLYNTLNLPVEVTDAKGSKTTSTYDAKGNLTSVTDASGAKWLWTYDTADRTTSHTTSLGQVYSYSYDTNGNLSQVTTSVSGAPYTVSYTYLPTGEATAITDPMGFATQYAYTTKGDIKSITNANSEVTQFVVDNLHRTTAIVDSLSGTWGYGYDADDHLTSATTPLGQKSGYIYSARGQLLEESHPEGKISRNYDAAGQLISLTAPDGTTSYAYNAIRQLTSATDPAGHKTTFSYNALGYLTGITDPTGKSISYAYDAMGNLLSSVDTAGQKTTFTVDALGRTTQVVTPVGSTASFAYNAAGHVVQATDPASNSSTTTYDGIGRKLQLTNPTNRSIVPQYDKKSRVTQLTTPRGTTFSWAYDKVGRIVSQTSPGGTQSSFAYNALGQLTAITDANNKKTSIAYDADGKATQVSFADGVARTIAYDSANRPSQVAMGGKTRSYAYDAAGRITSTTDTWGKTLSYSYTADGSLATITYPGNKTVSYGYDAAGRLTSVSDWLGGVTSYTYDAAGRLQQTAYPNGVKTTRSYDAASRLASLTHKKTDGSLILSQVMTYDSRGNITSIDTTPEPTGWIKSKFTQYDVNNDDQYTTIDGWLNLGYDPVGQMLARDVDGSEASAYSFDVRGRLVSAKVASATTSFAYGPEGERIEKTSATQTTRYVVDTNAGLPRVALELDASSAPAIYYIYGLGLTARVPATGTAIQYYHEDVQRNIAALTNAAGSVTDTYFYHPFGKVLAKTGATANPYQFAGQLGVEQDDTGLIYMRARYYDPILERFISKDPIGILGGLNVYDYVGRNPMSYADPSGLCPPCVAAAAWLAGALSSEAAIVATGTIIVTAPIIVPMTVDSVSNAIEDPSPVNVVDAALNVASLFPVGGIITGGISSGAKIAKFVKNAGGTAKIIENAAKGKAFEKAIEEATQISRNVGKGQVTVPGSGPGKIRVPDFSPAESIAKRGTLMESKSVQKLYDSSQLKDLSKAAKEMGVPVEIIVNAKTTISKFLLNKKGTGPGEFIFTTIDDLLKSKPVGSSVKAFMPPSTMMTYESYFNPQGYGETDVSGK